MKILHITPAYIPAYRYGGPIRIVHELNKWLAKKGVDVTVYTTNSDGTGVLDVPVGKEVLIDGVKVFYFERSFPGGWFYSKSMAKALAYNMATFDLVHMTSVFLAPTYLGSKYARRNRVPYIVSPRGSLMKDPFQKKYWKKKIYYEFLEKRILANAAAVHFTAEIEKKEYTDQNFPMKGPLIIPNGLDENAFIEKPKTGWFREKLGLEDKKVLLFLSRISWKKGFDTLIPALKKVVEEVPETVLVIAGGDDEGYKKEIERMIEENGLRDNVLFTGMLLGKEMEGAYQDADAFVLPSYAENFANAVVEAMFFKLPVVVTEGVGVAKDVSDAAAGLVVKKDVNALAEALSLVLSNKQISKKMGEAGHQLVLSQFSWDNIAEKLKKEYELIING